MPTNLFSTYSTGENRVTASILAVLRSLSLGRIERLLGALMEQSEFQLVRFENQYGKEGGTVPDAMITSSCRLFVETKIKRNAVHIQQLRGHLKKLKSRKEVTRALLVLTPDDSRPEAMDKIHDQRLIWSSFAMLDQAIEELLADKAEVVSEREAFLLRELQIMLAAEGLIGSASEVLVVPARHAWPEYRKASAYVCQPKRPFQAVKRIAFYCHGQIQPMVPTILRTWQSVPFVHGKHKGWLGALVKTLLDSGDREEGDINKVMRLSPPDDPKTISLDGPIVNDLESASGQTVAFTQNQRYVPLDRLRTARFTSELVET